MSNGGVPAQDGNILEVRGLKTYFYTEAGVVKAVDGVDFSVKTGECLGLVGQPGKIIEGEILFNGRDLLKLSESEMVEMRGNRISMIFQQPQSSLNPVFMVAD